MDSPTRRMIHRLAALAGVVALLWPSMAMAHHIMGLPHYKYGDDYPQIPYVEVLAQVEQTNLHFTYFPGTPKPGERVRFKLYAYDRDSRVPYRDPLKVDVITERMLGSDEVHTEPLTVATGVGPEANDYKFFLTFEEADAFKVRVYFPDGDDVEVIPFPVQIGVTDTRPLLAGSAALLVFSVVTVGVLNRRRRRRTGKSESA